MGDLFLHLDLIVALGIGVFVLDRARRGHKKTGHRFLLGVVLGLSWEVTFFFRGPQFLAEPDYLQFAEYPLWAPIQPLMHALWDGGLFLIGCALVETLCPPPHFQRFRASEWLVLVVFGNAQELAVELIACGAGLWTFLPRPWNPALFQFGAGTITLLPQLIWTAAPTIFYAILVLGAQKERSCPTSIFRSLEARRANRKPSSSET